MNLYALKIAYWTNRNIFGVSLDKIQKICKIIVYQ